MATAHPGAQQVIGLHSARCLMWSFDFADVEVLQRTDRWN
jgi:aspartate racemase